nr:amidohydrolase family protein [Rhizobium sp.]
SDYRASIDTFPVAKTVHVQNGWHPGDPVGETAWLAGMAVETGLPTAIVAYADLADPGVDAILDGHLAFAQMRGVRQILNWHDDPALRVAPQIDLMEQDDWRRGFRALADRKLSFDLQIYWPQMRMAQDLARDFPETPIVLNHFGMPIDRSAEGISQWKDAIRALARAPNVAVKLSGFGLGHPHWSIDDTVPLLTFVIDVFGPERVMFGSNLPVDLLFSPAAKLFAALERCLSPFSAVDRRHIARGTAERIYRL